jgi:hypothetical protein
VGAWPAARLAADLATAHPSTENLELVEVFGVGPTEPLAMHNDLSSEVAERILRNPTRYSTSWLAVADRSLTVTVYDRALKTYADTNWGI